MFEHDRTEEVAFDLSADSNTVSNGSQVGPQRFPLLLLVPDIWSLKERDDEALGIAEYDAKWVVERLHLCL